jgi:hypothetical protein
LGRRYPPRRAQSRNIHRVDASTDEIFYRKAAKVAKERKGVEKWHTQAGRAGKGPARNAQFHREYSLLPFATFAALR